MMKAVGQRDMSAQEVMHQLLSLKLFSSSYQVVTVSLNDSRKFDIKGNNLKVERSLLDDYAEQQSFAEIDPIILKLNFTQFASQYFVKDSSLKKPVIVRTFPTYSSSSQNRSYGLFCKYQLLRYKPWFSRQYNAWEDEEQNDATFIFTGINFYKQSKHKHFFKTGVVNLTQYQVTLKALCQMKTQNLKL